MTISASGAVAPLLTYPTGVITLSSTSQKVQMSVNTASLTTAGSYCGIISFNFACGSSSSAAQQCVAALVSSMVQQINDFQLSGIQATSSVVLTKNAKNPMQMDAKLCIDVFSSKPLSPPPSQRNMCWLELYPVCREKSLDLSAQQRHH